MCMKYKDAEELLYSKVTEHWNKLLSEVEESPVELFKTHLNANLCDPL